MQASDIQVINTITPKGDSDKFTINFTTQTNDFSIGSGRILLTASEMDNVTEFNKAETILNKLKEVIE
ncbi:hypothetical protein [Latilactobacillus sakei]|uniref:hypothetical protein n=1 Tax=Latilactobacillus sakei TaxID=1599 RepID=UPI0009773CBC|nr:hypothetical protein [Latilactobacillus sakei]